MIADIRDIVWAVVPESKISVWWLVAGVLICAGLWGIWRHERK